VSVESAPGFSRFIVVGRAPPGDGQGVTGRQSVTVVRVSVVAAGGRCAATLATAVPARISILLSHRRTSLSNSNYITVADLAEFHVAEKKLVIRSDTIRCRTRNVGLR